MKKRVVIDIGGKNGSSEQCAAVMDTIKCAVKASGGKVLGHDAGMPTALVEITEACKRDLQQKFPQATIEDEIRYKLSVKRPPNGRVF